MRILIIVLLLCSPVYADNVRLMSQQKQTQSSLEGFCGSATYDFAISRNGPPTSVVQGADVYVATWERFHNGSLYDILHMTFRKSDNILVAVSYDKRQES